MAGCDNSRHLKVKAGAIEGTDILYVCNHHIEHEDVSHDVMLAKNMCSKEIKINVKAASQNIFDILTDL